MAEKQDGKSEEGGAKAYLSPSLEWLKVLLPVFVSWPVVGLLVILAFHRPIASLIDKFADSPESAAEIGPVKIKLGKPVLPPQYREAADTLPIEILDLREAVGKVGDTGQYGSTVGFSVMYAIRAAFYSERKNPPSISAWGIYETAKRFDEYVGNSYDGTSILGALKDATKVGVFSETDWPYASGSKPKESAKPLFKIKGYARCETLPKILAALRENKVVVAAVRVTPEFDSPADRGLVVVKLPIREEGLKTIGIVGYNSKMAEFVFVNDWGDSWGDKGFGRIKDSDLKAIVADGYTVEM